jgi:hypothetical protein
MFGALTAFSDLQKSFGKNRNAAMWDHRNMPVRFAQPSPPPHRGRRRKDVKYDWWEEYACGCVSPTVSSRKNLLGYCPKHGANRRVIYKNMTPMDDRTCEIHLAALAASVLPSKSKE